jgi:hypothetical protein
MASPPKKMLLKTSDSKSFLTFAVFKMLNPLPLTPDEMSRAWGLLYAQSRKGPFRSYSGEWSNDMFCEVIGYVVDEVIWERERLCKMCDQKPSIPGGCECAECRVFLEADDELCEKKEAEYDKEWSNEVEKRAEYEHEQSEVDPPRDGGGGPGA